MNENIRNSFHVTVPQMGEGLKFAKVVRILKNVGDRVGEDDDVVEVETAKATLGISSAVAGVVSAISCRPGDTVDIGVTLLEITRDGAGAGPVSAPVPERSFNQQRKGQVNRAAMPQPAVVSLPGKQLELIHYMRASQQIVVPASVETRILWDTVDGVRKASRTEDSRDVPSGFEIICWAAARAMQKFEKLRGRLSPENTLDISAESLIGVAAAGADDTIDTRVVSFAPEDGFPAAREKMRAALKAGPAGGYHSLSISDMSSFQVVNARPVVVYPAAATLFIGAPYWAMTDRSEAGRYANLVLAFDHRLMNGVYAAKFMKEIDMTIRRLARNAGGADAPGIEMRKTA